MDEAKYDGIIEKVLKSDRDGMCRFTMSTAQNVKVRNKDGFVVCTYITSRICPGLPITVSGTWKDGIFAVKSMHKRYERRDVYNYLVRHCRKIGKVIAENTLDALGSRIFSESADGIRQRLTDLGFDKHITSAQMEEICERLKADDDCFCELQDFVASYGGEMTACTRIYDTKGGDALDYIRKDPYGCCMSFGIGFTCADRIAKSSGLPQDVPARLEALAWTELESAKDNGDSYLPLTELAESINELSGDKIGGRQYTSLRLLTEIRRSKRFREDNGKVYLTDIYNAEEEVADMLAALSRAKAKYVPAKASDIAEVEKRFGIEYSPEQKVAFKAAGQPGVSMIIGGPGTGKTTVMNGIADVFAKNNPGRRTVLCAPTGRAAKRLAEATGRHASTVHSMLHYVPFSDAEGLRNMHNRDNPLDADLIILDEFSMMSLPLFRLFLDAIRPGTSVILVGDKNQLPSVEVGNVLSDLMASGCFPVYELESNYRQAGADGLAKSCKKILGGNVPSDCDGVEIVKSKSADESLEYMEGWFFARYEKTHPFDIQILSPSYKGVSGINAVNTALQEEPEPGQKFCKGDKVIFTRTSEDPDGAEGYINGDMGIITDIGKGTVRIKRDWDGTSTTYPDSVLEDVRLAYDISVHRSQGSEFKEVLVYLSEKPASMLKRNLLYTAVTRAKVSVTILYEGSALERAVADASALLRYSGLGDRIKKRFGK